MITSETLGAATGHGATTSPLPRTAMVISPTLAKVSRVTQAADEVDAATSGPAAGVLVEEAPAAAHTVEGPVVEGHSAADTEVAAWVGA